MSKISKIFPLKKELLSTKKLLLLIIVLGGALFFVINTPQELETKKLSTEFLNEAGEYVIELTEEGYLPKELVIKKGETVRFKTSMNEPFWPASNSHPTHGIYNEFDPKVPIDPTDSWAFTFNRTGRWMYHDHLYSYFTGVILVIDEDKSLVLNEECQKFASVDKYEKAGCFESFSMDYLWSMNLEDALEVLNHAYKLDPGLVFCEASHRIV